MRPSVLGTSKRILLAIVALLVLTASLVAQTASGRLHGQVTDPTGAVIPGVTITLKDTQGRVISAKSDDAGAYDVKGLVPGRYVLSANAKDFLAFAQAVEIAAGQEKKLDFSLEVKGKEEEVVVESEGAKVSTNPDNNASTLVISGKDLDALSDDPDELQSELQALAGPSAGPNGGQIYIDGFTGGQLPPKSSIREIRVNQNPFSAQYDRMGFGRIEILTKPGTDKLHGQFFYNDNHSIFDAHNPFAAVEPDFSTEMINGNVGGPLSKKASYFINVERRNIHDAAVILPSAFTNSCATPPCPAVPVLNPRIRTAFNSRIDYQLASNNTLMVRYQHVNNDEKNDGPGQLNLPSLAYNQTSYEHTVQVSDTQVLSPRAINETRFEWERGGTNQNSLTQGPTIRVLGAFTGGGNPLGTSDSVSDHYEVQNYTSINLNTHFLRLGGRLRATALTSTSTRNFNGTYTFASLTSYQAKTPSQLLIVTGNPLIENTFVDAGIYAEDDWKIRPNMTLSYGLRFETQNGINHHGDWAPRLGFAWGVDAKKNAPPKTILRTGFGIFYDRFGQSLIVNAQQLNGSNQRQFTFSDLTPAGQACLSAYPNPQAASCPAPATGGAATTYTIAPNLRTPYTIQAVASVERQLSKAATVTVSYIHSHGVHQLFSVNTNALTPGATPADEYVSEGTFNQNQMITSFNMRAGARLSLFSYYSLSYANGDTSGASSFPSNPALGITADYGRTGFDIRNRAFFGGSIGLARGFRLSPFMVATSGPPFDITIGEDENGDSQFNDRPALASVAPGSSATSCAVATLANPVCTVSGFPAFNLFPGSGAPRIPINFGTTPARFTLNMRLSKTFGIGPRLESVAGNQGGNQQGGNRGPGGPGGGRGPGGPGGGGHEGGGGRGPGGPMGGIFAAERTSQRYNLTFSANARNLFNNVNAGAPIGNLNAPIDPKTNLPTFGTFTSLAGEVFNTQSANRRIDFQVMFSF